MISHRFRNRQIEAEKADRQLTLYLGGTQRRSPSPNPINLRSPESAGILSKNCFPQIQESTDRGSEGGSATHALPWRDTAKISLSKSN